MLLQTRIRLEAINYVRAVRERWVAVPASELSRFTVRGKRIHLKGQKGIFKPKDLSDPISITSTLASPYTADVVEGRCVYYDYVPPAHDNTALKRCAEAQIPLIYLLQVKRKPNPEYIVFAPVYVMGWDDERRQFLVDLSEQKPEEWLRERLALPGRQLALPELRSPESPTEIRELSRAYLITSVQHRLRQARFRDEVLAAYRERCAVCLLHVRPLLNAARVVPDDSQQLTVDVRDGIALCATHHRAFDAGILRIDTNYVVRIDLPAGVAGEGERAMLLAYDGRALALPRDETQWPRLA